MAKQNPKYYKQKPVDKNKQNKPTAFVSPIKSDSQKLQTKQKYWLWAILAITLIVYFPSLFNGFVTNWDDGGYITKSEEKAPIQEITAKNLKKIWDPTNFYKGNYHPLTTTFYMLEYNVLKEKKDAPITPAEKGDLHISGNWRISNSDAFLFHFFNLIFHLANVWLVFLLIRLLSKRFEIAIITALIFAIHPMHVESVAWISERKDVLYTFFFLLSLICYINYFSKEKSKLKNYSVSVVLFLLSLFSKSAAVCLPVVLLLIDYFLKRKFTLQLILEKIPYFALAFTFGILAILSQKSANAIQDLNPMFSFFERLLLASFATMSYLWRFVVPVHLSTMHPYPDRIGTMLPTEYYVAPVVVIVLLILVIISIKRNKAILFGTLFFFITIGLVLQLLPVGGAIISERYSYVPYIGLGYMVGYAFVFFVDNKNTTYIKLKPIVTYILIGFGLFFSYLTFNRIGVWKRGDILFMDVVDKYPNMPFAYNNLGYFFYTEDKVKDYTKALNYYNKCLTLDPNFHRALSNRGVLYFNVAPTNQNKDSIYNLAVKDFSAALKLKSDNTDAWIGRANTYSSLNKFDEALPDYDAYLKFEPTDASAWEWRGTAKHKLGKYEDAITDFNQSALLDSKRSGPFYWKGLSEFQLKRFEDAIKDFDKALSINPNIAEMYSWRGLAKYNLKQIEASIADYSQALKLNPNDAASLVNRSVSYSNMKRYLESFNDLEQAVRLGYPVEQGFFMRSKMLATSK